LNFPQILIVIWFYALLFETGRKKKKGKLYFFLLHVVRTWIGSPAGGGTCMYYPECVGWIYEVELIVVTLEELKEE